MGAFFINELNHLFEWIAIVGNAGQFFIQVVDLIGWDLVD